MAQSVQEIKDQMSAEFLAAPAIQQKYDIDTDLNFEQQFSKSSFESILFYIGAFLANIMSRLFDTHKAEITDYITRTKPHSAAWYATKAKEFLLGVSLVADTDIYNTSNLTEDDITTKKIVKYAAVSELDNAIRLKVAKVSNGQLAPLETNNADGVNEMSAFQTYINKIRDAGTKVFFTSTTADLLKISMKIFYNPLVLKSDGKRIDDNSEPIPDAINSYIQNIEFDGKFITTKLIDAIQAVEGVEFVSVNQMGAKYGIMQDYTTFEGYYSPFAGYCNIGLLDLEFINS
jgi:hypothetical protein